MLSSRAAHPNPTQHHHGKTESVRFKSHTAHRSPRGPSDCYHGGPLRPRKTPGLLIGHFLDRASPSTTTGPVPLLSVRLPPIPQHACPRTCSAPRAHRSPDGRESREKIVSRMQPVLSSLRSSREELGSFRSEPPSDGRQHRRDPRNVHANRLRRDLGSSPPGPDVSHPALATRRCWKQTPLARQDMRGAELFR